MSTPLDANEVRKDFEMEMVFGIEGIPRQEACLKRHQDGRYESAFVETAWRGYLARAAHHHARAERLRATRFIGNGDRTAVREILMTSHLGDIYRADDQFIDGMVRAILKHFEGMPT